MSEEMKKMRDELIDHIDKALVSRADQIPASWSAIIKDLTRKLDSHIETHERDTKAINEKLDPIHSAFQSASGFKATIILLATTVGSIWAVVEGWKKLSGK